MPTLAQFVERFPEFSEVATDDPTFVQSRIDQAATSVDADVMGDKADELIGYKAAAALSRSPLGQQARLSAGVGETTYDVEIRRLVRERASGPRHAR